jgi:hypothetical protein
MPDQELSDITLAWMISQLEGHIDFDHNYVTQLLKGSKAREKKCGVNPEIPRTWGFGNIDTTSNSKIYRVAGDHSVRTPGEYTQTDENGKAIPDEPLKETHEYVHASVRIRLGLGGPGINDDKGRSLRAGGMGIRAGYKAEALTPGQGRHGWKLTYVDSKDRNFFAKYKMPDMPEIGNDWPFYAWVSRDVMAGRKGFPMVMPEDLLGRWEDVLLSDYPRVDDEFLDIIPEDFDASRKELGRTQTRPPSRRKSFSDRFLGGDRRKSSSGSLRYSERDGKRRKSLGGSGELRDGARDLPRQDSLDSLEDDRDFHRGATDGVRKQSWTDKLR